MGLSFVYPAFLWGLFLIAIPIIIHLFRWKRYKKEYFSQIALLERVKQEYKKQHKLKDIIILLCRIGLIASLVFAFARPYIGTREETDFLSFSKYSVYIDNSYSMSAPYKGSTALEAAKKEATLKIRQMPYDARVQVLTNEFKGEQQRFNTVPESLKLVSDIVLHQTAGRSLKEVYLRELDLYKASHLEKEQVYRINISDFQQSNADFFIDSTAANISMSPDLYEDIVIDSADLEQPIMPSSGEGKIRVWLRLKGKDSRKDSKQIEEIPLRLFIDGGQVSVVNIRLTLGEVSSVVMPFRLTKAGFHFGELRVEDPAMEYNNSLYLTMYKPEAVSVLHIYGGEPSSGLLKLFGKDSTFIYNSVDVKRFEYASVGRSNMLVLEGIETLPSALSERLKTFIKEGGSVVIVPPRPATPSMPQQNSIDLSWSTWLKSVINITYKEYKNEQKAIISKINKEHSIWKKALSSLPNEENTIEIEVDGYYELPHSKALSEVVLSNFLESYNVGKGKLYLFASPWQGGHTKFVDKYSFVVCMLGMALESGGQYPLYVSNKEEGISIPYDLISGVKDGYALVRSASSADTNAFIPELRMLGSEQRIYGINRINAGNYWVENSKGKQGLAFSINTDKKEWEQKYVEPKVLGNYSNNATPSTQRGQSAWMNSSSLWKIFLIFALVFALVEQILLRKRINK